MYNNLTMSHIVPDLVDNAFTTQTTLGELLATQLCHADAPCLWVATAYFNLDGLEKLGDALDKVQELRLLIGTEPDQEFLLTQRLWRELEGNLALISPARSRCWNAGARSYGKTRCRCAGTSLRSTGACCTARRICC